MFSFFKRNKKNNIEKQGDDSVISSQELIDEEGTVEEQEVHTVLVLPPSLTIPQESEYVLRFLNNELPPLKPNQISLAGIELRTEDNKLIVSAFVRNSLAKGIHLSETSLLLIGPNGEQLARKVFNLADIGEIPAKSSVPWHFVFEKSDVLSESIPSHGWKLAFELRKTETHRIDFHETWENALPQEEKDKLRKMVEGLPALKQGEVNFLGLQAKETENGDLHVTVLIRNGNTKNIQIHQLPLLIEDASGVVVAKGGFTLDNFEIKANTSKPWTFIFPKELVLIEKPDLSKWKVSIAENN